MTKYSLVATGGTFDRLHEGHEALLEKSFGVGEIVIIGLTSDALVKSKQLSSVIEPYELRLEKLKEFLRKRNWLKRARISTLHDVYGPTVLEEGVQAIVCTSETLDGAREINVERRKRGLKRARVIRCRLVLSDDRKHISSTRMRLGEEDRQGVVYKRRLKKKIVFSREMLEKFKAPWGELIATKHAAAVIKKFKPTIVILVGDVVFENFKALADVSVIDFKTRRKKITRKTKVDFSARNPAGTITPALVKEISQALKRGGIVGVEGEEDLAVIPAVLLAPLGSVVAYGQPNEGVVVVRVSEESKKKFFELIK